MGKLFSRALDVILEDQSLFANAAFKSEELKDAQSTVANLEGELEGEIDTLLNRLALEIRRKNPRLTVSHGNNGTLRVNYGRWRKGLDLGINLNSNEFKVGPSKFEREFLKHHHYILNQGVEMVAGAVADFFSKKYRSMR